MPWTPHDIPDQSGRTAVVTGANGGLGVEVARELARRGAHVVMAVRTLDTAHEARADIEREVPGASLEIVPLDLGALASVREAADAIADGHGHVDLLVNNAGIMAVPPRRSADGHELQLAVNHLGHFALTALLAPRMVTRTGSRVVSVTSTARHVGRPVDPDDPNMERRYGPWLAYGRSKLANLHFAVELDRRLAAAGAATASLVAHPGLSDTGLQARSVASAGGPSQRFFHWLAGTTGMSAVRGAHPLLRAATDPTARGAQLYAPQFVNSGPARRRPLSGRSLDRGAAERLWSLSERLTGITFDVAAVVRDARARD